MIISLTGFMGSGKSSVGRKLSELLCCRFMDLDEVISERAGKSIPEIFASEGEGAFRRMEAEALRGIIGEYGRGEAGDNDGSGSVGGCKDGAGEGGGADRGGSGAGKDGSGAGRTDKGCSGAGEPGEDRSRTGEPGDLVLALGGGTVMTPECAALVSEHTFCIYLRASVDTLLEHLSCEADDRPMLKTGGASGKDAIDLQALRTRIMDLMALRSATYESVSQVILDTDGKSVSKIAALCIKMSK